MEPHKFDVVAAIDEKGGIARKTNVPAVNPADIVRTIPWNVKADMAHFRDLTTNGVIIMGRKTLESLTNGKFTKRINIVVSRTLGPDDVKRDVVVARSLTEALEYASAHHQDKRWFVIGGAELYSEAAGHPLCNSLIISNIPGDYCCDLHFPVHIMTRNFEVKSTERRETFTIDIWKRR
jgi:dihydrofolate reductase